jgi:adenosylcobinamide-GDP ribazoletransferase
VRAAIGFLTRLPVGGGDLDAGRLSRAAIWFPVVGAFVGGVVALVRLGAGELVPAAPATALALLAAVLITGGLHEDGLADVADAFGAHTTRERRLEIMRDPRIGTYGGLAIGFALILPFSLLAPLDAGRFAEAVFCVHVLGRCAPVIQSRVLPPARADGAGALLRVGTATATAVGVTGAASVIALAGPDAGGAAVAIAIVAGAAFGTLALRAVGGVTGDAHGAATKVIEVAVYAALVATWS